MAWLVQYDIRIELQINEKKDDDDNGERME